MSLTAPVTCVLFFVAVAQGTIKSGVFEEDNIQRYTAGSTDCSLQGLIFSGRSLSSYQVKDRDCCYQKKTRDHCCIEKKGHGTNQLSCKCDPYHASDCQTTQTLRGQTMDNVNEGTGQIITGTEQSLCHDSTSLRLLRSKPVLNECTYGGIIAIKKKEGETLICNAVYTTVELSSMKVKALVTPKDCMGGLTLSQIYLEVEDLNIPGESFIDSDLTAGNTQGFTYLKLVELFIGIFSKTKCTIPACVYKETMLSNIEFGKCKMISYGKIQSSDTDQGTKLREVKVNLNPFGCKKVDFPIFYNTNVKKHMCFKLSEGFYKQEGDGGAAVYCKAKSNNEDILVGVAAELKETPKTEHGEVPVLMLKYKF